MDFENLKGLAEFGFEGGVRVSELQRSCQLRQVCLVVPSEPGVYSIVRKSMRPVRFSKASRGGWFKQRGPTLPVATLKQQWLTQGSKYRPEELRQHRDRLFRLIEQGGPTVFDRLAGEAIAVKRVRANRRAAFQVLHRRIGVAGIGARQPTTGEQLTY